MKKNPNKKMQSARFIRETNSPLTNLPADFNWRFYLQMNPDVAAHPSYGNEAGAIRHWLQWGHKENRFYSRSQVDFNIVDFKKSDYEDPDPEIGQMTRIVYTCISSNYDRLKDPTYLTPGWRYICFTDQNISSDIWEIKKIPPFLSDQPPVKRARAIKVLSSQFLPKHDISIWIDGSIEISGDLDYFINETKAQKKDFMTAWHPERNNIYQELEAVIAHRKDLSPVPINQIEKYKSEGYCAYGLVQTGIIIRKNAPVVNEMCQMWWNEIAKWSHRDQLSFNYVYEKYKDRINADWFRPGFIASSFFRIWKHTASGDTIIQSLKRSYDINKENPFCKL